MYLHKLKKKLIKYTIFITLRWLKIQGSNYVFLFLKSDGKLKRMVANWLYLPQHICHKSTLLLSPFLMDSVALIVEVKTVEIGKDSQVWLSGMQNLASFSD